jgi:DNA-directed RNA polymerase I, II, and III subunit RPABC5
VISNKYKLYLDLVKKYQNEFDKDEADRDKSLEIDFNKTASENAFDKLLLKRYCCRRHLLSHTDLINII